MLNNSYLTTDFSLEFTGGKGKQRKALQKCGCNSHRWPLFLTPALDAVKNPRRAGEISCPSSTCSWTAEWSSSSYGFLLPPMMLKEEVRSKRNRESRSTESRSTQLLSHAMARAGTGEVSAAAGQGRRKGTVFLSGKLSSKWGKKRQRTGESSCLGLGQRSEGR